MQLANAVALAAEHTELPLPAWAYGVIAFVILMVLAFVTYSYRDVFRRRGDLQHANRTGTAGEEGRSHS